MATQQADGRLAASAPHSKVTAAGVAGAGSIVLMWFIEVAFSVEVPAHVASAMTSLIAFAAGYLKNA